MELAQAKRLISRINKNGGKARIYEGYSGRGMFGDKTTGVVCGPYDIDFKKTKFRYDNLGLDMIVY